MMVRRSDPVAPDTDAMTNEEAEANARSDRITSPAWEQHAPRVCRRSGHLRARPDAGKFSPDYRIRSLPRLSEERNRADQPAQAYLKVGLVDQAYHFNEGRL